MSVNLDKDQILITFCLIVDTIEAMKWKGDDGDNQLRFEVSLLPPLLKW